MKMELARFLCNYKIYICVSFAIQFLMFMWINLLFYNSEEKFQRNEHVKERTNDVHLSPSDDNFCPRNGEDLVGLIDLYMVPINNVTLVRRHSILYGGPVQRGGWWKPKFCTSKRQVAILVPYRKRAEQLKIFLNHMHPVLQKQQLSYRIFVVEQVGSLPFNKGAIFNFGFLASLKYGNFDCYVFHDVDLLTENDENYYGCPVSPMHMSVAVDKFFYKLPYQGLVGGVAAFDKSHFLQINGYSNSFWGWGAEDDDLFLRITKNGLRLFRPPASVGRYTMNQLNHFRSSKENSMRKDLLETSSWRADVDGLNNVRHMTYKKHVEELPLYTLIKIDLY